MSPLKTRVEVIVRTEDSIDLCVELGAFLAARNIPFDWITLSPVEEVKPWQELTH